MNDPVDDAKRAAAYAAADLVQPGMRVGLGTGSTFVHVLARLAQRARDEGLDFVGVATSEATAERARSLGLRVATLDDVPDLDLAIDGADEVDPNYDLIKGGGGALLREKIVAAAARQLVIVVDDAKLVPRLGERFPLPVEVVPFGSTRTSRALASLSCAPKLRQAGSRPFVTDNDNYIFDCKFAGIDDPFALESAIDRIPGVVECGLFVRMTHRVIVGKHNGACVVLP